ncbi:unnamed protein product [Acanthoscelides obtectus]|uniref:Uncharacterized protein n=1 Tax=Acanthoscelides obtectus TaxID=200917 RepID=A0A9P0LMQ9_ACAOB|nr:unnamed protein product [Acanthoscelides obtectus]CAK1640318.1 hypothetical protein AOBTE_LOCUS11653 [Acanthoscelides obtectus]
MRFDGFSHWPEHIEPKQRCRNCIKSYTRISCMKCNMPLCLSKEKIVLLNSIISNFKCLLLLLLFFYN